MIMGAVTLDPSSEHLFKKYRSLVDRVASKFAMDHGEDFEEVQADAYLYYVNAVDWWDRRRIKNCKLSVHIAFLVWSQLIDKWRVKATRRNRADAVRSVEPHKIASSAVDPYNQKRWSLEEFLEDLTEDGRTVAKLCLSTPKELTQIAECKGGHPQNYRSTIKQWLESAGWTYNRVRESFEEVRKALG